MRPRETGNNAWRAELVSSGPRAPEGSLRRVASRMPPAQSPQLMQLLLLLVLVGLSWAQDIQMCENIRDDLGAASCAQVLEGNAKGFRLTGTMNDPLRFAGLGFDDNIAGGETPGALNVCMLAAFGDGGVIPAACVPTVGTTADQWDGVPEMHYFGMIGFDCSFNHVAYAVGETIDWDYPTGNTCVGDGDLDVGLTSIKCMFESACELGTTTTTMAVVTSTTLTTTQTQSTTLTATQSSTLTTTQSTVSTSMTSSSATNTVTTTAVTTTRSSTITATYTASTRTTTTTGTGTYTTATTTYTTATVTRSTRSITSTSSLVSTSKTTTSATASLTQTRTTVSTTHTSVTMSLTRTSATTSISTTTLTTQTASITSTATSATVTETITTTATGTATSSVTTETLTATAVTSTGTDTSTTTSTGSPAINITGRFCPESPMIANSASLAHCAGTPHNGVCDVECSDGFTRPGLADVVLALCHEGRWRIRGECLPEGTNVTQSGAAQVLLDVALDLPELSNFSDGYYWARAHETALYWAFAKTLGVHPAELRNLEETFTQKSDLGISKCLQLKRLC
ncbi:unnamed protein product [Symbiodinium sp. CCMP2456]|nr:unnamed protein product [Symbiodinium sp. CCMP2456]